MSAPRGNDYANGNNGGAPEGNQNAQRHGLFSERSGYYADLSDGEQDWIDSFTHSLLDRFRRYHDKDPDAFDRETLKHIAIDFHRTSEANDFFSDAGLVHREIDMAGGEPVETIKQNVWASELRRYQESIMDRMDSMGLLESPDKQQADAMQDISVDISYTKVTEENVDEFTNDD